RVQTAMRSRCALVRSNFEPSTREEHGVRVLELWAVDRRCFVPQVFAEPGKKPRNTRTRRILRQAFGGCNAFSSRTVICTRSKKTTKNTWQARTGERVLQRSQTS